MIRGCRRSRRNDKSYSQWLCPRHWKAVDKGLRDRFLAAKRLRRDLQRYRDLRAYLWPSYVRAWEAVLHDAEIKAAFGADGAALKREIAHEQL